MSVSGVGSNFAYIYNSMTGKLSTKDGSADEFVDYFNGDLAAEESKELNGFDAKKKGDIESMIFWFTEGAKSGIAKDIFNNRNGYEYEISGEIVDAVTGVYSVNGEKIFTAFIGVGNYTPDEIKTFTTNQPFITHQSKGYDPATNSINIAVGDVFDLGNGYRFTVEDDHVSWKFYGKESEEMDVKANQFNWGLSALIHFADQQWMSDMIIDECTPMILEFIKELGVDTSKEFTINETKCHLVKGKIKEVGNVCGVPSSIYNKAVKRYEEELCKPLSSRISKPSPHL